MEKYISTKQKVTPTVFGQIAHLLLNKSILMINQTAFRICEIEFYLHSPQHPDPYVHCHPDQLNYGVWYFHRFRTGTYKGGTWKGMDLALGDKHSNTFCGILIRTIMNIHTEEIIEGPCKTVDQILRLYNVDSVDALVGPKNLHVLKNWRIFHLLDTDFPDHPVQPVFVGPRVGLSSKYPGYSVKLYRYLIFSNKIEKQKSKRRLST